MVPFITKSRCVGCPFCWMDTSTIYMRLSWITKEQHSMVYWLCSWFGYLKYTYVRSLGTSYCIVVGLECGFPKLYMECGSKVVIEMITIRFIVIILIGGWEITKKHNLDKGNTCSIKGQCNVISRVRSLSSKLSGCFQLGLASTRDLTTSHLLMNMRVDS